MKHLLQSTAHAIKFTNALFVAVTFITLLFGCTRVMDKGTTYNLKEVHRRTDNETLSQPQFQWGQEGRGLSLIVSLNDTCRSRDVIVFDKIASHKRKTENEWYDIFWGGVMFVPGVVTLGISPLLSDKSEKGADGQTSASNRDIALTSGTIFAAMGGVLLGWWGIQSLRAIDSTSTTGREEQPLEWHGDPCGLRPLKNATLFVAPVNVRLEGVKVNTDETGRTLLPGDTIRRWVIEDTSNSVPSVTVSAGKEWKSPVGLSLPETFVDGLKEERLLYRAKEALQYLAEAKREFEKDNRVASLKSVGRCLTFDAGQKACIELKELIKCRNLVDQPDKAVAYEGLQKLAKGGRRGAQSWQCINQGLSLTRSAWEQAKKEWEQLREDNQLSMFFEFAQINYYRVLLPEYIIFKTIMPFSSCIRNNVDRAKFADQQLSLCEQWNSAEKSMAEKGLRQRAINVFCESNFPSPAHHPILHHCGIYDMRTSVSDCKKALQSMCQPSKTHQ